MSSPKKSEHYVNNKDFLAALIDYHSDVELSFFKLHGREPTKKSSKEILIIHIMLRLLRTTHNSIGMNVTE